ncbi:hypothetical protein ATE49_15250 [Elizabethkingia miricola]|uniref:hypothetical protein n=1 Tax=Elizabethkingia miricola TaxID=172045 RepID=UPI0007EE3003|nr:hypothetical protein [Elizabethkingia miricola]OBS12967.1 hypothetical protein ATE49_15250 [Elizabethkingia miricola]
MSNKIPENLIIIGSGEQLSAFCQANGYSLHEINAAIGAFQAKTGAMKESIKMIVSGAVEELEETYIDKKPRGVIPPNFYKKRKY